MFASSGNRHPAVTTVTRVPIATTPEVALATRRRLWVLVPSFLLGAETWRGVGEVLEFLAQDTVRPRPVRTTPRHLDHLTPWVQGIADALPPVTSAPLVVVGHSGACPRLAMVVAELIDRGHLVESMILVNGRLPEDGVVPTERDFPMSDTLDALVRPDDYLPPWHRWWGTMIGDMLPGDEARRRILDEAKPVPRAVFDQPIPAPVLPRTVGRGYLALGDLYAPTLASAIDEGYKVRRLEGEHLHMVVQPVETAAALLRLSDEARACARTRA